MIEHSELILQPDGRVYHLNVKDADIADRVILVGDPARVDMVATHFDNDGAVEYTSTNREFRVKTGKYKGVRITALSTGIGCDNLDIVVNELDAAVNIDPDTRRVKDSLRKLTLVRLGTCGALQADIEVDSTIVSAAAMGLDGVAHFYTQPHESSKDMASAFMQHVQWPDQWNRPYARRASTTLLQHFGDLGTHGITITANGFFGPQGRFLRLPLVMPDMNERFRSFTHATETETLRVTNFEMECSALYALGQALGHDTLTMCVAIANRYAGKFSEDYHPAVDKLIVNTLEKLVTLPSN